MLASTLALLGAAALANAQSSSVVANAPVVTSNPIGASYIAELPVKANSNVVGSLAASSAPDGKGVLFALSVSGLPSEGGPFMYHIHEKPVPADGNCTGTGTHLDPYKRGETPACDGTKPETCQTGDLSGKYGTITGTAGSQNYIDLYSSTNPSDPAYFGNLSVVIHLANKTRVACANFKQISPGVPLGTGTAGSSGYALPTGTGGYNHTLTMSTTATGTGSPDSNGGQPTATPPAATTTPPGSGADKVLAGTISMLITGFMAMLML